MRIGFDAYTIEHRGLSVEETLDSPASAAWRGCSSWNRRRSRRASTPAGWPSSGAWPSLEGLALEVGLPSPNPVRRSRLEGRAGRRRPSMPATWPGTSRPSPLLGCRHARAYLGDRHDRFRPDVRWPEQVEAPADVLKRLEPALRDHGTSPSRSRRMPTLTADEIIALLDALRARRPRA